MKVIYLFHILIFGGYFYACDGVQYYISEYANSSRDAKNSCTLASPPIRFDRDANDVTLDKKIVQNFNNDTNKLLAFWIGYVQAYTSFLYKGCASHVSSTTHTIMMIDPGQCFSRCQTNIIGLQETTCHCITRLPAANQLLLHGCNLRCSGNTGLLCGNSSHISVYQQVMDPSSASGSYDCLTYNPFSIGLSWEECLRNRSTYHTVCQKDDNSLYVVKIRKRSWNQAMQLCIKKGFYPGNVSNIHLNRHLQHKPRKILWTGQIRSHSILHTHDTYTTQNYDQGYVAFQDGLFKLYYGATGNLHSICKNSTAPLSTSLPSVTSPLHSSTGVTTSISFPTSTTKGRNVSVATRSTTAGKTSGSSVNSGNGEENEVSEKKGSTRVILYIAIPLTLVVIIGVIVCILWRRRSLPFCKRTEEEETTRTTTQTKLELQTRARGSQNNDYVLEPMCLYEPMQGDACKDESAETDYDTATPGGLKQHEHSIESSNVYNKLDIMPAYSHIGVTVKFAMHSDDTYNHIDAKSGENVYDSTASVPDSGRINKYPNDAYSHIGGAVNLAMDGDATYNHIESKGDENMYDSTSNPSSNIDNKYPDDTYSKVNKKS